MSNDSEYDEIENLSDELSHTRKRKHSQSDRDNFFWCHQCKQKHVDVVRCTKSCSKKYCTRCVVRHYKEKPEKISENEWVCYYCRGVCSCAFCRRRRAKETNTKFESHRGKKRKSSELSPLQSPKTKKAKEIVTTQINDTSIEMIYARAKHNDLIKYLIKIKDKSQAKWIEESQLTSGTISEFLQSDLICIKNLSENIPGENQGSETEIKEEVSQDNSETLIEDISEKKKRKKIRASNDDALAEMLHIKEETNTKLKIKKGTKKHTKKSRERINLKNLLESGILKEGCELILRIVENPGVLLSDGSIQWGESIFPSLSSWTKHVAEVLKLDAKTAQSNGWRSILYKGKSMGHYKKQYKKLMEYKKIIEEESSEETNIKTINEPIILNTDDNSVPKSFEIVATPSPLHGSPNPEIVHTTLPKDFVVHTIITQTCDSTQLVDQTNLEIEPVNIDQHNEPINEVENSIITSDNVSMDELDELWIGSDEDDRQNQNSINDDFSVSCYMEPESDLLCGQNNLFLDIKDKDFFNVTDENFSRAYDYESGNMTGWRNEIKFMSK